MRQQVQSSIRRGMAALAAAATLVAGAGVATAQQPALHAALGSSADGAAAPKKSAQRKRPAARRTRATHATAPASSAPTSVAALASDIGSALASHTKSGEWGAIVVSLTRGDTLFEQNADAPLEPASTMKMYTSAITLDHFGPDYRFHTPVLRDGAVGADGTLAGNLYLKGVGDPSIDSRFWKDVNPMDALAKQIAAAGIKRVHGDVMGDATAFDDQLIPDGWKTSYLGAAYAARVSALSLDENLLWVEVKPNGGHALVTLDPASTTIPINASVRVTRGSGGSIRVSRQPDGSLVVRGSIGASSGPLKYSFVADNPALYTIGALRASLQKAGIVVDGQTRLGASPANAVQVTSLESPPLSEIIGEMDRESINIFAELLFRATTYAATGRQASAQSGLAYLRDFLSKKVGTAATVVDVTDGSGLSPLDHVTPRSMVRLLGYVHRAPWGPTFDAALPVEGESGTLKRHGKGAPSRGNLHAKTGTTNTVAALGGYVTAKNGEVLAFSLIYNGSDRWGAKAAMDQIGATMASFVRE